jgi:hypothetical protein
VAGGVGDDEGALGGREEAISDVDGDALLALGFKSVDQKREVEIFAGRAVARGILRQRRELILEDQLGVVQKPPDQGRLTVIDRAAGNEAEQVFRLAGSQRKSIRNILRVSSFPSTPLRQCR